MEGMTLDASNDKLYAFLQSPLSDGTAMYSVTKKVEQVERLPASRAGSSSTR
jgi:hypothetical protein